MLQAEVSDVIFRVLVKYENEVELRGAPLNLVIQRHKIVMERVKEIARETLGETICGEGQLVRPQRKAKKSLVPRTFKTSPLILH